MRTATSTCGFAAHPRAPRLAVVSVALMLAACTPAPQPSAGTVPNEPVNVGLAKLASVEYHDSGNYMSDLRAPPRQPATGCASEHRKWRAQPWYSMSTTPR